MFEIFLSNIALKSLKKFNSRFVQKAKKALIFLKSSPIPINEYDIKKSLFKFVITLESFESGVKVNQQDIGRSNTAP